MINWIYGRLKEPSTSAGAAALLLVLGVHVEDGTLLAIMQLMAAALSTFAMAKKD